MGLSAVATTATLTAEQRAAAIAELEAHDELEGRAARTRLEAFLYRYLPGAFYLPPGAFHRRIYADIESLVRQDPIDGEPRAAAAFAYPRGHGKTTTITLGFALWVIAEWRSMPHFRGEPPFILIVSDTMEQARDRSLDLRDELEANDQLVTDYPKLALEPGKRRQWTEKDWTTPDGVRIKAVGSGTKVRGLLRKGRRPTLILIDDLENDEAVATQARREKLERWLQKALLPTGLHDRLLTIAVGTILHADSLLSRLLSPEHYPGWLKRRYAALYNDAGLPDAEGSVPLWPEGWPMRALRKMRDFIGSVAFVQEYLNQPVDDASALFRWAWLQAARARGAGLQFLYAPPPRVALEVALSSWDYLELAGRAPPGAYQVVVTAWDLGIVDTEEAATAKDSDYTVGLTLGLDMSDRLHVLRIWRKRGLTPGEVRARVVTEYNLLAPDYIVVENNAAQRVYEIDLRGKGLPIVGHTTDKKKHSVFEGVPGLALQLEHGQLDFHAANDVERSRIDALIAELHGLGHEAHDDLVMALWMAVCALRRWRRRRDEMRVQRLGPPPAGYVLVMPERDEIRREAA